jgi:hypothetical protein
MAKTTTAANEWAKSGFADFAVEQSIDAPFTTIANRAKVNNALRPAMGSERIYFKNITQVMNEFGPNGERMWQNQDEEVRVRFGGHWFNVASLTGGQRIQPTVIGDFMEVTFWGTGLNLLAYSDTSGKDFRMTIDGGTEGASNVLPVLNVVNMTRNYAGNIVLSMASGLALGWHTIRFRNATASNPEVYGVEILNETASIQIPSGSAFSGFQKESLAALATSSYNADVVGTKGARVVKYLKDGAISQVVTNVDTVAKYLTNADHTNEDIIRTINWKEFGINRADDFTLIDNVSNYNRSFTLEDGITTLTGFGVRSYDGGDGPALQGAPTNAFMTLTFVGTGLDALINNRQGAANNSDIYVDGNLAGNTGSIPDGTPARRLRLCSGLPYGTHTVRIQAAGATSGISILNFIIYGPKKPTLPAGAVELCDYNVVADHVPNGNAAHAGDRISQGVIRKHAVRDLSYQNAWTLTGDAASATAAGFYAASATSGHAIDYHFVGTGVEIYKNDNATYTLTIDGSTNFSAYTTGTGWGTCTITASTGAIAAGGGTVYVKGLPFGKHTIRLTKTNTSNSSFTSFDLITPIHINDVGTKKADSLRVTRQDRPTAVPANNGLDLSKAKAWVVLNPTTGRVMASYNIAAYVAVSTGRLEFHFAKPFKTINYVTVASADLNGGLLLDTSSDRTTPHKAHIITVNTSHLVASATWLTAAWFGEQEGEGN